jgi:hypothetical protein
LLLIGNASSPQPRGHTLTPINLTNTITIPLMLPHQINNRRRQEQAHDHVRRRRTQLKHANRLRVPNVNDMHKMTDRPHLQKEAVLIKYFVVPAQRLEPAPTLLNTAHRIRPQQAHAE